MAILRHAAAVQRKRRACGRNVGGPFYGCLVLTRDTSAESLMRQLWRNRRAQADPSPFDLIDFCLGLGWVTPALAIMGIAKSKRRSLLIGGLLTPVAIAVMGLMQAENARVWIFLMPLIALPAAIELSTWPLGARLEAWDRAVALYRARRWSDAAEAFAELEAKTPTDGPSRVYLERARTLAARPPGEDWDGVFEAETK